MKLTTEEISKAENLIKQKLTPKQFQDFLSLPEEVKVVIRYFVLSPKKKQDGLYKFMLATERIAK